MGAYAFMFLAMNLIYIRMGSTGSTMVIRMNRLKMNGLKIREKLIM